MKKKKIQHRLSSTLRYGSLSVFLLPLFFELPNSSSANAYDFD